MIALLFSALFPLAEGTRWVYRGTTRGDYHRADVVRRVETTMRVIGHAKVGKYELAVIDGGPDTISCDRVPEPRRMFTVVIRDGNRYYETATPNPSLDEFTSEEQVAKQIDEESLFLETPLQGRKTIGCEQAANPPMYCWSVEQQPQREIVGKKRRPYRLTYRSSPTLETVEVVEGVGVTRWQSVHHGSPCEIDLRLVSFKPAR